MPAPMFCAAPDSARVIRCRRCVADAAQRRLMLSIYADAADAADAARATLITRVAMPDMPR